MVDLLFIQTVGVIVAAFSVVVGIANNILTSRRDEKRNQQTLETRQAQLFMQIYNKWSEKDFVDAFNVVLYENPPVYKDYDDYVEKYVKGNPEYDRKISQIYTMFEGVGVLVRMHACSLTRA